MKQYFVRFSFELKDFLPEEASLIFDDKCITRGFNTKALNYQCVQFIIKLKNCTKGDILAIDFKIINKL